MRCTNTTKNREFGGTSNGGIAVYKVTEVECDTEMDNLGEIVKREVLETRRTRNVQLSPTTLYQCPVCKTVLLI